MENKRKLLAIDVGAGTQDILLYEAGQPIENSIKLVLPSPTVIKAQEIREATASGQALFLSGHLMGGGANKKALEQHLEAGYAIYAQPGPAKTIKDDLEQVEERGIEIVDTPPAGIDYQEVVFGDLDLDLLARALNNFGVELPQNYALAVQDHGENLEGSDRQFRFEHWRKFVQSGGQISELAYLEIPDYLTRMKAVQNQAPGALVMDTGAAAIRGALCDQRVAARREEGIVIVNIGNLHTLAILVKGDRIWGLFEHHTSLIRAQKLEGYIKSLRTGELSNQEVYAEQGHGAYIDPQLPKLDFDFVAITGPNRHLAAELGYYLAVPHGDMMLSGCFGLLAAARERGLII